MNNNLVDAKKVKLQIVQTFLSSLLVAVFILSLCRF